jgi:hypothetical protein
MCVCRNCLLSKLLMSSDHHEASFASLDFQASPQDDGPSGVKKYPLLNVHFQCARQGQALLAPIEF